MRLDKFLVACAVGSRTEVKNLLKAGRVTVNGKKEKSAKLQINEEKELEAPFCLLFILTSTSPCRIYVTDFVSSICNLKTVF